MAESITVETLRERLEKGERISVLDVRAPAEHAAWSLPGALSCPASDDLAAGRAGAVKTVAILPRDRPVVVVDAHGKHAPLAAETLHERGYRALALVGGMDAWSTAWNLAEVAMPPRRVEARPGAQPRPARGETRVLQVRRTGKGCLSYVVGSGSECAVVDPSVDVAVYRDIARQNGWTIRHILETHVHADHLTRAQSLASLTHAKVHLPRAARVSFHVSDHVEEGTTLRIGGAEIVTLATPGHTSDSVCYLVDGHALLTGDTLLLDSVARIDLETDRAQGRKRAGDLHTSVQRLFALPADTFVLPGHASAPVAFDRRPVIATLRQVRERVPLLTQRREDFAERLARELPPVPETQRAIARANETGTSATLDISIEAGPHGCATKVR